MKEYPEPKDVFHYFSEISKIPRGSGNTAGMTAYLTSFAKERDLTCLSDPTGNVVIRKKASPGYEKAAPCVLQGHVDMVCVKEEDSDHDFLTDPIRLTEEGGWIHADKTTLGADDGIAVAYMLAILDNDSLSHPALEMLFTVDEETGMDGAMALDPSWIRARRMINLDSDEEGTFIVGCAGGMEAISHFPLQRTIRKGVSLTLSIGGLRGGHSGGEIHRPVASANRLLGRILWHLAKEFPFGIVSIAGGDKKNAIAQNAAACLVADRADIAAMKEAAAAAEKDLRGEFEGIDDGLYVRLTEGVETEAAVFSEDCAKRIVAFLYAVPHGVERMSAKIPGATETSTNLGVLETEEEVFTAMSLTRSACGTARDALADRICALTEALGGTCAFSGRYPAWEFHTDAKLLALMHRVYAETFGREPNDAITHGGLECGFFSERFPGMEIVSMGPEARDIHTPKERLSVGSTQRIYAYLLRVLAAMKDEDR